MGSPLKSKLMSMYFPKRLELSLRFVLALPKASNTQLDFSKMFFTLQQGWIREQGKTSTLTPWDFFSQPFLQKNSMTAVMLFDGWFVQMWKTSAIPWEISWELATTKCSLVQRPDPYPEISTRNSASIHIWVLKPIFWTLFQVIFISSFGVGLSLFLQSATFFAPNFYSRTERHILQLRIMWAWKVMEYTPCTPHGVLAHPNFRQFAPGKAI